MYAIGKNSPGKMAAIINANNDILKELLIKYKKDIVIANFNSPNQQIISGHKKGRSNDEQISVADLTGVAVQDIQIAKAILDNID